VQPLINFSNFQYGNKNDHFQPLINYYNFQYGTKNDHNLTEKRGQSVPSFLNRDLFSPRDKHMIDEYTIGYHQKTQQLHNHMKQSYTNILVHKDKIF
jgi:hypothetical protein